MAVDQQLAGQVHLLQRMLVEQQQTLSFVQERYAVAKFLCVQLRRHVRDLLRDAGPMNSVLESAKRCTALLDSFPAHLDDDAPAALPLPASLPSIDTSGSAVAGQPTFPFLCPTCRVGYFSADTPCTLCGAYVIAALAPAVSPIRDRPHPAAAAHAGPYPHDAVAVPARVHASAGSSSPPRRPPSSPATSLASVGVSPPLAVGPVAPRAVASSPASTTPTTSAAMSSTDASPSSASRAAAPPAPPVTAVAPVSANGDTATPPSTSPVPPGAFSDASTSSSASTSSVGAADRDASPAPSSPCASCGSQVAPDMWFCGSCGARNPHAVVPQEPARPRRGSAPDDTLRSLLDEQDRSASSPPDHTGGRTGSSSATSSRRGTGSNGGSGGSAGGNGGSSQHHAAPPAGSSSGRASAAPLVPHSWAGVSKRYPTPHATTGRNGSSSPKRKKGWLASWFGRGSDSPPPAAADPPRDSRSQPRTLSKKGSRGKDKPAKDAAAADRAGVVHLPHYNYRKFMQDGMETASHAGEEPEVIECRTMLPRHLVDECMFDGCKVSFKGLFKGEKSNHCRNCGKVYCSGHIVCRMPLPRRGHTKPVKVCSYCHASITGAPRPPPVAAGADDEESAGASAPPDPHAGLIGVTSSHLLSAMATLGEGGDGDAGSVGNGRSPSATSGDGGGDVGLSLPASDATAAPLTSHALLAATGYDAALRRQSTPVAAASGGVVAPGGGPRAAPAPSNQELRVRGTSVLADIAEQISMSSDEDSEPGEDVAQPVITRRRNPKVESLPASRSGRRRATRS